MKSSCIFACVKARVKVHLCTFLSSACQVVRGYSGRLFGETPCFCFSLQEREREGGAGCKMVALWLELPFWMMCMERCLVQLSTLHSKRPFFNSRESHPQARTPLPSNHPTPPHPTPSPPPTRLQNPSSFLPCFPWLQSKCFMWLDWGRLEVDPCPCPQKTLVFQWDEGVLVLAGWSRWVEGFTLWGGGGARWDWPPGRERNKRTGELSHGLFFVSKSLYAPLERYTWFRVEFCLCFVYLDILHVFIVTIKNPRKLKMRFILVSGSNICPLRCSCCPTSLSLADL